MITAQSLEYLQAYDMLTLGFLPHGAGWLQESQKFIEAMRVCMREVETLKREAQERARHHGR